MSRLRKVFNLTRTNIDKALNDGTYGVPGYGSWSQGMAWNPGSAKGLDSMRISAVYACFRLLTDAIATLPVEVFREVNGGREIVRPVPSALDFKIPRLTKAQYLTQVVMSMLADGNAFVAIVRTGGAVTDLVPLDPTKVKVKRDDAGRIVYEVDEKLYSYLDILHIPGLVQPGALRGLSPIAYARDVIDTAGRAQDFGRSWFENSAVPPAVIQMPVHSSQGSPQGPTDMDRAKSVAATWNATHGGTSNAGKVGVLIGGAELKTVAIANRDSQWIESRQFSVQEIARIFGVPPHLIADSSNSTSWGSGLAEQNLAFGQFSLRPYVERIEDAHDRLLSAEGYPDVFWKLNLDALLRASLTDRYASYSVGIESGFLLPNEARALEELPPIPGGDSVPTRGPNE